jgi:lysyl-tRNA synthetase class 2
MASLKELKEVRLGKLEKIKASGLDPYPAKIKRTHKISELGEKFLSLSILKKKVTIVGRIMSLRGQGALAFVDLYDGSGRFQALLKKDDIDLKFFREVIDESDFISVTGTLFKTKKGQKTIAVKDWKIVAKSISPIPDEFYGLKDEDERYRRRYIDILLNNESKRMIERKSVFWNSFREFLLERDFVEVQTPVLENTAGGADARPFITHHNTLDVDMYLRISAGELWQKRLMVAGLEKTFEIGRIFRNEGMSNEHLQDYTQLEFYQAYSDYEEGMKMVQELYRKVAKDTFETTKFNIDGKEVDLNNEWEIYDFVKILKDKYGVDVLGAKLDELKKVLLGANIPHKDDVNKEKAVDMLWKNIRDEYVGPGFLINIPVFLEPLAKKNEDGKTVQRFQIILGGSEMGKGFSELNDPIDQRERFEHQESLRDAGDDEAQMNDSEYVEAMEYGMPPAFGFGVSERLFSVLSGKNIRETTIFPIMRSKKD